LEAKLADPITVRVDRNMLPCYTIHSIKKKKYEISEALAEALKKT
jgi:hypothetical protein